MLKRISAAALTLILMVLGFSAFGEAPRESAILDALGDDACRSAYEALQSGATIRNGSQGEHVRTVQMTLIELGQDIAADGVAGPKTMEALGLVQTAYGDSPSEELDAEGCLALLEHLLFLRNPDAAGEILASEGRSKDEIQYRTGCALEAAGRFYQAQKAFEASRWKDAELRAQTCVQTWPNDGELHRNPAYYGGGTRLTIQVSRQKEGDASLFKIYAENGDLASCVFLAGTGKARVSLPNGSYYIKMGSGSEWFGMADAFGGSGRYETLLFQDREPLCTLKSGMEYTLTVNTEEESGNPVGSEYEYWESF